MFKPSSITTSCVFLTSLHDSDIFKLPSVAISCEFLISSLKGYNPSASSANSSPRRGKYAV